MVRMRLSKRLTYLVLLFSTLFTSTCLASATVPKSIEWDIAILFTALAAGAGAYMSNRCTLQVVTFLLIFFYTTSSIVFDALGYAPIGLVLVNTGVAIYAHHHGETRVASFAVAVVATCIATLTGIISYQSWVFASNLLIVGLFTFVAITGMEPVLHRMALGKALVQSKNMCGLLNGTGSRSVGVHRRT